MKEDPQSDSASDPRRAEYEPPLVERVMDADELGREVLYAGRDVISG